jgi:hypothetical protein
MKIFSFFGQRQLETEWMYKARGGIWRLLFSSDRIVGECRNHELKRASFFCLEEHSGSVLWQEVQLAEPWWVGIEAVHRDVIVLHQFANPGLPEHKGMIVLDLGVGNELWRNEQLTYWFAFRDHLYAYKTEYERRTGYKVRSRDGVVEQEFKDTLDDLFAMRQLAMSEELSEGFVFPEIAMRESLTPQEASVINSETKGAALHGEVEMVRKNRFLLFNYYTAGKSSTPESPMLENRFSIHDLENERRIFSDILCADAKAPTPDSFFLKNDHVFFVKLQDTLTALRLEPGPPAS